MSAFRIGQRVRILWSVNWPELAGETEKGGDFAAHTVADLGVALAKLRAFGGMAGPTLSELNHAKQARARYSPGTLGDVP